MLEITNEGKVVLMRKKENGEREVQKEYHDIFSGIRGHIYALKKFFLGKEEVDPLLVQGLIQRASYLISVKNVEVKEVERSIIELKALADQDMSEKAKLSAVNKVIARLRNLKALVFLKEVANKYILIFNNKENLKKIDQNIKEFINELEEKRKKIQEEERKLKIEENKSVKEEKISPQIFSVAEEKYVAKIRNEAGGELFITFLYKPGEKDLKLTSAFIREEKLYDYSYLKPKIEDIVDIKKALEKIKEEEEINLGRS
ncbi:MAG: hypothetical protein ACPLXL_00915 [Minisyncoccia bacterium]